MENAVDALKIAFAVLIFVIALSITFSSIAQAKKTSDFILTQMDKTNFYEKMKVDRDELESGGRKVNVDTIISNLYKIKKEAFEIKVISGSNTWTFGLNTMDAKELDTAINEFKKENWNTSSEYLETFSEVKFSGKSITGNDGSSITTEPGIKKIYITYKKIS